MFICVCSKEDNVYPAVRRTMFICVCSKEDDVYLCLQ